MTAARSTRLKPREWPTPLALPLWVGGAVFEFIRRAWHGRPRPAQGAEFALPAWERRSLASLRRAIVGNGKRTIAAALGPPPTASATTSAGAVLDGDTWYYPLCRETRWCMAVTFKSERAKRVEFFRGVRG
jgi:hypothetical protein